MARTWDDRAEDLERKPMRTAIKWGIGILLILAVLGLVGTVLGLFTGTVREAAQVTKEEFGPRALLKKYEWFKDTLAALDKKEADIKVYEGRFASLKESYGDTKRSEWDRTDKEQYNQWMGEVAGITASYNSLASEYNAQMAKFNWRFTNAGDLPKGATQVLPREVREYKTQ